MAPDPPFQMHFLQGKSLCLDSNFSVVKILFLRVQLTICQHGLLNIDQATSLEQNHGIYLSNVDHNISMYV